MSEPDDSLKNFRKEIKDKLQSFESARNGVEKTRKEIEAKNLLELDKQTDIYDGKREAYFANYQKEYDILRETWDLQRGTIFKIWSELIKNTEYFTYNNKIKSAKTCKDDISKKITEKQNALYGIRPDSDSKNLEDSKAAYDKAIQHFKMLTTLGQAIKTRQVEINKWIDKIKEIRFMDIGFAIYLFWDKVFHPHRDLAYSISDLDSCEKTNPLYSKDNTKKEDLYCAPANPREGPWLINPNDYLEKLDYAYLDAYKHKRNDEFAKREIVYTLETELDELLKAQKDWTDKFDEKVKCTLHGKCACPVQSPAHTPGP